MCTVQSCRDAMKAALNIGILSAVILRCIKMYENVFYYYNSIVKLSIVMFGENLKLPQSHCNFMQRRMIQLIYSTFS